MLYLLLPFKARQAQRTEEKEQRQLTKGKKHISAGSRSQIRLPNPQRWIHLLQVRQLAPPGSWAGSLGCRSNTTALPSTRWSAALKTCPVPTG